ncbi:MAG: RNA polymerase sporulation sigma factor SigF [Clostridia bacterium]|jgi:RNA polymerase sporulation-specific sigma factor|nr:RNA polymerase sporulation sigma factor SigF [Clostridiales bacterium]
MRDSSELFSHDITLMLIKKAQQGDKEAQSLLLKNNIGLIKSIVKRFLNRGYEYEDLFQLGSIGLLKAIKNFDPGYNVRFSTYAVPMIAGEIKRFIRDDGIVKVSRSLKELNGKIRQAKDRLTKENGKEPTLNEISEELGVPSEDVVMAIDATAAPEYLYDTIHQDDGSPIFLIDKVVAEEDKSGEMLDRLTLKEMIRKLKPRERQIIMMRYFQDRTQTQIAQKLGISQVQVSRIEKRVLDKMRQSMTK